MASNSSPSTSSLASGRRRAAVLVTGEELLRGAVSDVNGNALAASLTDLGLVVTAMSVVGDGAEAIADELARLAAGGNAVIAVSGGLGGTHDDCTMEAVALAGGGSLEFDDTALSLSLGAYESSMGKVSATSRTMARKQALMPRGATMLPPVGTAPGCIVPVGDALVCVLPGPPWECEAMWLNARSTQPLRGVLDAAPEREVMEIRIRNAVESEFVECFSSVPEERREGIGIGVCARDGELEVTLRDERGTPGRLDRIAEALEESFGQRLYSRDGAGPAEALLRALSARGETISVAESCTGGGVGSLLTDVVGASSTFLGGVIAYGNSVKETLLGVPGAVLDAHGAVSEETAEAMAEGARRLTGSDWGVAVTGIAGPGGGTAEKPVGRVWVSVSGERTGATQRLDLRSGRDRVRRRAALAAIHLSRETIEAEPAV